jgi:hypothetical protein
MLCFIQESNKDLDLGFQSVRQLEKNKTNDGNYNGTKV